MKTLLVIAGLMALSFTTAPALAGSCGGGDHTHTYDEDSKKKKMTGI